MYVWVCVCVGVCGCVNVGSCVRDHLGVCGGVDLVLWVVWVCVCGGVWVVVRECLWVGG
jgi:hypothetical protein